MLKHATSCDAGSPPISIARSETSASLNPAVVSLHPALPGTITAVAPFIGVSNAAVVLGGPTIVKMFVSMKSVVLGSMVPRTKGRYIWAVSRSTIWPGITISGPPLSTVLTRSTIVVVVVAAVVVDVTPAVEVEAAAEVDVSAAVEVEAAVVVAEAAAGPVEAELVVGIATSEAEGAVATLPPAVSACEPLRRMPANTPANSRMTPASPTTNLV